MNVPFHKAAEAADDVAKASKLVKEQWEMWVQEDTHPDIVRAHEYHVNGLRNAWKILNAIANAPADDLAALLTLHDRSPKAFEAHMVHIRLELERKEEPSVEEKAA